MTKAASILPAVPGQTEFVEKWLTGSQRKTAFALRQNCERMIAGHNRRKLVELELGDGKKQKAWLAEAPENLNCTGFLTLTVGDLVGGKFQQVFDAAEASRRINNLNRRVLPELFERAIVVTERHKSGAIHFHVLGVLRGRPDIRTGFDFDEVKRRNYKSASPVLKSLWERLRTVLPEYGFGRSELTPIRKSGEAVACYVSKYIEKNVCNRLAADARKKLVRYIGFEKSQLKPNEFSWGTERARAWRGKAREIASLVGVYDRAEWGEVMGPRWAFQSTRLMHGVGDNCQPFLILGWREREMLRAEVVNLISLRKAREIDGKKLQFSEEFREMKAAWQARNAVTSQTAAENSLN